MPSGHRLALSPLPRRSVMDAAHWAASPEPAGESGLALARTERAICQPHRPLPWLSPLRARPPRSLVSFWLPPIKVKGKVEAFLKRKRVRPADVPQKTLRSLRSANPLRARALFSRTGAAFSRRPKARIARGGLTPHPPCGFAPALFCRRWSWAARPHTLSHGGICRAPWRASRGFAALSSAPGCPHSPWPAQWWP